MKTVCYVSEGQLYKLGRKNPVCLGSEAVLKYHETIRQIHREKDWKTTGRGAAFMGVNLEPQQDEAVYTAVEAVVPGPDGQLIYAASLENSCAVCLKNPAMPTMSEGYVLRRVDMRFLQMDYQPERRAVVASMSRHASEKHIALCYQDRADFSQLTEGASLDITPSFSQADPNLVLFSSAGYAYNQQTQKMQYDSYAIHQYDLRSYELEELVSDPKYDFLSPRQLADGSIYCIRRPKQHQGEERTTVKDVLLMPWKLLKALFGWLNFFTQRYSGESLKKGTGGNNPAKYKQMSDEELFIEGNLVHARKELGKNKGSGDKYPGMAPKSWELVRIAPDDQVTVLQKGVFDYALDGEDILFANGKYILRRHPDGAEEMVCEAKLAHSLCVVDYEPPAEAPGEARAMA